MITRTERQKIGVRKWINSKGKGIWKYCTGFGKTFTTIMAIKSLVKHNPDANILISVPTDILKIQWNKELAKNQLFFNCKVEIINTVIKHDWDVDLLVIDEIHLACSDTFINIFNKVNYKMIIGLTGTLERLDGRHKLLEKYCPVIDEVSIADAIKNNWLSEYREYKVLIDVDLTEYNEINKKFNSYFAFFDFKFDLAMSCVKDLVQCRKYAKMMGYDWKQVRVMALDWNRCMRKRKEFVMSHPKKLELTHKILEKRPNSKCITFSATIKEAEKIKYGATLHSGKTKKKNRITLDEFKQKETGTLNTSKSADCGADIPGLNMAIVLSGTSSSIQKNQRLGRILRREDGKVSEMFSLVIRGTQEENWYNNASNGNYITITEHQLDLILDGFEFEARQRDTLRDFEFRF